MTAEELLAACRLDPVLAAAVEEDVRSIAESSPFVIRVTENPLPCARCGTWVARVRESPYGIGVPRQWAPAIWESENGRKHTLRRCEAMRARAA